MADIELDAEKLGIQIEFAVKQQLEIGLDKAADRFVEALEENAPSDPNTTENKYKDHFQVNRKYKGVRYVGNTKMVKNGKSGFPLSNILEYHGESKDHMRKTYDAIEDDLIDIILYELDKIF